MFKIRNVHIILVVNTASFIRVSGWEITGNVAGGSEDGRYMDVSSKN
jgi:hypothetical protein